jgi:AcrR family transcriptional regulator
MGTRLYAGLSADERTHRRREQLLEAGLDVFADKGWAAATVQEVCRSAGLSPRYFYELFDDREALFLAVTARIADRVQETVRDALAGADGDPEQRARAVLRSLAGFFTGDARMVRVAFVESLATERLRAQRRELLSEFSGQGSRLMRPLSGSPARGRPRRALERSAAVLTGGLVEVLIAWADGTEPLPAELFVDHLTRLYSAAARLDDVPARSTP